MSVADELGLGDRPWREPIAAFARDGLSSPEIGARRFLSPRAVERRLRTAFATLGNSESDLAPA